MGKTAYIVVNKTMGLRFKYLTNDDIQAFLKREWKGHDIQLIEVGNAMRSY